VSPAAVSLSGGPPTRSQIETWDVTHLQDAATRWRASAHQSEALFEQHRQNIAAPGGTEWVGRAKDAAWDRVTADLGVVRRQSDAMRGAAATAANGANDIRAAQRQALDAIADAEDDEFKVGEDLSVRDTRRVDMDAAFARQKAAVEHAEYIRWRAEQLLQTDTLVGEQLTTKAAELEGVRFDGASNADSDKTIQAVDFHGAPLPEKPSWTAPEPPPGGWSEDPVTRAAQKIAYGHAAIKHAAEFPGMSKDQVAAEVERIMRANTTNPGSLIVGRTGDGAPFLYDPKTNTVVIRDPGAGDGGTVFKRQEKDAYPAKKMPTRLPSIPPGELADVPFRAPPVEAPKPVEPPAPRPSGPPIRSLPLPGVPEIVTLPGPGGADLPVLDSDGQVPELPAGEP
jgi:hypothetical protein